MRKLRFHRRDSRDLRFPKEKGELRFSKEKTKIEIAKTRDIINWVVWIFIVCMIAFVCVWYGGQRVSNVGDSMKPILKNGDIVLVNRIVYNISKPKRNDIIVFRPNGNENAHYCIKRIIGLPGETVEIKKGTIFIDGKKRKEEFKTTSLKDPGIASEPVVLAGNEYFVLGDNRTSSEDSRMADIGNVKRSEIYGEAWFVASPASNMGFVKN